MSGVYYNEFDPYAAQWLKNLVDAGLLPAGEVDPRDMRDVDPSTLHGFMSWHFFTGIGGWPLALRMAGFPEGLRVMTGSPPCQPFSAAGKGLGVQDERHLSPIFLGFIRELRPGIVFGEQVATATWKDQWLDDLFDALEMEGYTTGAAILPACAVGAPHLRQRLYFVAESRAMENAISQRRQRGGKGPREKDAVERAGKFAATGTSRGGVLADPDGGGRSRAEPEHVGAPRRASSHSTSSSAGNCGGEPWGTDHWLLFPDGAIRPFEPRVFPLAHGVSGRVGRLRAYGNAVVPQLAATFVRAYMEARGLVEVEGE